MHEMENLRKMLMDELTKVSQRGVTSANLEMIDKLSHSIKSIDTIMAMDGYSGTDYSRNNYNRNGYNRNYSGDGYAYGNRRRYSMGDSEIDELRDMLNRTSDSKLRNAIQRAIDSVEM